LTFVHIGLFLYYVKVKAGKSGTLRSLHVFVQEKNVDVALRFNRDFPSMVDLHAATVVGGPKAAKLISLPLYLVEQWPRLVGCQAGGIADPGGG